MLAVLTIVINFLVSLSWSPEELLNTFVHDTLKMPAESSLVSARAQQFCRLKHVKSLWRFLTIEKEKRLSVARQV